MTTITPIIRNPNGFDLFDPLPELLKKLFANYEWIVIQSKFSAGATGSVFVVRPADELPTVAKFAPAPWIQREEAAYKKYVNNKLPNTPTLDTEAIYAEDGTWGALRYQLVGSGQFEIEDLFTYYEHASEQQVDQVIKRLFKILEPWWQEKRRVLSFQLRGSYDRLLPVNLVIRPDRLPQTETPITLPPAPTTAIPIGAWVRLEQSYVKKITKDGQVLLTPVQPEGLYPETYHLYLDEVQSLELFQINQILPVMHGQVLATRADLLSEYVETALINVEGLSSDARSFTAYGRTLPNPLAHLSRILSAFHDVHVAYVHGDLNLQNILIDKDTGHVNLIDFGSTAQDHILHDFLRLETEIVTKILPRVLSGYPEPQDMLLNLYQALHLARNYPHFKVQQSLQKPFSILHRIRRLAARHLYKDQDWIEYYEALALYLLGSLRFSSIDSEPTARLSKQFAFLTAAFALHLCNESESVNEGSYQGHTKANTPSLLNNIPPCPALVIGRENDLHSLKERIGLGTREKSALTIVRGWPGVGKSTTVITLAYESGIAEAFPDGVLWASLGETPNIFSELAAWGRALGVDDIGRTPTLQEAVARLTAILRDKQMLLIVDDVWETEHALPFKSAGQKCATIFTTRFADVAQELADVADEQIYNLRVLTDEKALELLQILTPKTVEIHPNDSLTLVRDLEGLPLAIQVAGRLLYQEEQMGWSVVDLIAELREGAKLLQAKAPADRADIANQTTPTVAALLNKSTDTLSEEMRDHFAFLGAFAPKPATFDVAAMAAVWQIEDPKPAVRVLVGRGLLEQVGERFQMHALLVAHARSLLGE